MANDSTPRRIQIDPLILSMLNIVWVGRKTPSCTCAKSETCSRRGNYPQIPLLTQQFHSRYSARSHPYKEMILIAINERSTWHTSSIPLTNRSQCPQTTESTIFSRSVPADPKKRPITRHQQINLYDTSKPLIFRGVKNRNDWPRVQTIQLGAPVKMLLKTHLPRFFGLTIAFIANSRCCFTVIFGFMRPFLFFVLITAGRNLGCCGSRAAADRQSRP